MNQPKSKSKKTLFTASIVVFIGILNSAVFNEYTDPLGLILIVVGAILFLKGIQERSMEHRL